MNLMLSLQVFSSFRDRNSNTASHVLPVCLLWVSWDVFLLQLETLQASYEDLKAQSQEEIRHLWSQLESMKTNREELNGEEFCGVSLKAKL